MLSRTRCFPDLVQKMGEIGGNKEGKKKRQRKKGTGKRIQDKETSHRHRTCAAVPKMESMRSLIWGTCFFQVDVLAVVRTTEGANILHN